jgi:hypothetical protein
MPLQTRHYAAREPAQCADKIHVVETAMDETDTDLKVSTQHNAGF